MTSVALRVERLGAAEYVCAGRGRPMGLAHGASGDVDANFAPLLDALGDRWSFIGSRYPGTGGSGPVDDLPSVLRPEVLADRLVEALDAEGHLRVPVAGVSFGCAVAIETALRHPDRVSALVLTVGFARPDLQLRQMLGTWEELAGGPPERLGAFLLSQLGSPDGLAELDRAGTFASDALAAGRGVNKAGLAHLRAATQVDLEDRLAEVRVPTLVVVAGSDRVVLPATTRELAAGIPGAELVEYPAAGHAFTAEEGAVWARDVEAFLGRVDDRPVGV
ncbi:MAG: alpha/beta hydrolase [Propionibacteriales bacterium]|nr:alpha/beta hydrolase [Propionibacteriales bacterium]